VEQGGSHVFVEEKRHASFLALFWVAVPLLVVFRLLTVGETTTPEWVVIGVCVVVAVAIFVVWARTSGQDPGRIEVTAEAITQWHRNGRYTRVGREPIVIAQLSVGDAPGTWYLQGTSGQVLRGVPGGEADVASGQLGLLGYDPFAVAAACDELGWPRTER
jgi:hypothetical protein